MAGTNHYSTIDYRKLIAWDKRLAREWTFLEAPFATAPVRRVLDLGSGTGEHARCFAEKGFEVVGVDVSDAMLARALEGGTPEGVRFLKGDLLHVDTIVDGQFGVAVCLGNTLAHITDRAEMVQMFAAVRKVLVPGAPFILQVLNYEHLVHTGQRSLPLTFIQDDEGEEIFLRVMTYKEGGRVVFTPTVLRYRPDEEPPITVESSHNVELKGWTHAEVESALTEAGFASHELHGTMGSAPFIAADSHDLVVIAR